MPWVWKDVDPDPKVTHWVPPGLKQGTVRVRVWEKPVAEIAQDIGIELRGPKGFTRVIEATDGNGQVVLVPPPLETAVRGLGSQQRPFYPSPDALAVRYNKDRKKLDDYVVAEAPTPPQEQGEWYGGVDPSKDPAQIQARLKAEMEYKQKERAGTSGDKRAEFLKREAAKLRQQKHRAVAKQRETQGLGTQD